MGGGSGTNRRRGLFAVRTSVVPLVIIVVSLRGPQAVFMSNRQILRRGRGQGNVHFPCSADHEQDWQPYPFDLHSAICDDHTIHTYIQALWVSELCQ